MAYSWIPIIAGQKISVPEYTELQNNLDDLLTNFLELTDYDWGYTAVQNEPIQGELVREIRTAVDYADDMNYCRTHNSSEKTTYNNALKTDHDAGLCPLEKSSLNTGHLNIHYITDYGIHDTLHYETDDTDHLNAEYSSVLGSHNSINIPGHNSSHHTSKYYSKEVTHNASERSSVNNERNQSANTSDYSTHLTANDDADYAGNKSTQYTGHETSEYSGLRTGHLTADYTNEYTYDKSSYDGTEKGGENTSVNAVNQ